MSYLDPHRAPEPRGWERPGDQRDPDWPGGEDTRLRFRPGGSSPAVYPETPDQQPGFPQETASQYRPPPGYEPVPPYPASSPYGPAYSAYDTPTSYDTPATYDTPPGYDTGRYPDTFPLPPADPPRGGDQGYPVGPPGYRQSAAGTTTEYTGWESGSATPVRDQSPPDGYHPGGYETGRYQPDDQGPEPYRWSDPSAPYPPDPYQSDPHHRSDAVGPALAAPTDPVGWAPIDAEPDRAADEDDRADPPQPVADPYADTQTLPRIGAQSTIIPNAGTDRAPADPDGQPAETGPSTVKPRSSRAGRNLPAAIGVGLALGALIVVPLFVYPLAFLVVIAAAVSIGTWELTRAVRKGSGAEAPLPPLLAGGLVMVGLAWWAGPDALSLALLVTVLATLVWRLADGPRGFQRDLTAATFIAVYVPFLGGFAALLAAVPDDGHLRVLVTLVAVVLSDTGGYAAGVTFGKHPMAPSVSPKKSWEGFAGSVLAAAGGSALLLWYVLDVAPQWGALFGAIISVVAVLGDLGESVIKRDLGVKDMSNLLPGHGGLMDRLDSVLFAMPAAYLLLALFVPTG